MAAGSYVATKKLPRQIQTKTEFSCAMTVMDNDGRLEGLAMYDEDPAAGEVGEKIGSLSVGLYQCRDMQRRKAHEFRNKKRNSVIEAGNLSCRVLTNHEWVFECSLFFARARHSETHSVWQ